MCDVPLLACVSVRSERVDVPEALNLNLPINSSIVWPWPSDSKGSSSGQSKLGSKAQSPPRPFSPQSSEVMWSRALRVAMIVG